MKIKQNEHCYIEYGKDDYKGKIVKYIKHHIPIIIQYEDGTWCNANIKYENNTLIIIPDYNILFED